MAIKGGKREGAGRKKGIPNKSTQDVRDLVDAIFKKVNPVTKAIKLLEFGTDKTQAAVLMRLLEYRYGKPKETVELTGSDGGAIEHTIRFAV